jgi:hypothetical protein
LFLRSSFPRLRSGAPAEVGHSAPATKHDDEGVDGREDDERDEIANTKGGAKKTEDGMYTKSMPSPMASANNVPPTLDAAMRNACFRMVWSENVSERVYVEMARAPE